MAGFVVFYWRQLLKQRQAVVAAAALFVILAIPVYTFSFTSSGLIRFREVALFDSLSGQEAFMRFFWNYFAYFRPNFLFFTDVAQPNVFFIQRLKYVGLLYWFELPLIVVGLYRLFKLGQREQFFWLYWLLVAPLGINLHVHSPKPALWLTATPTLQGLAGAGLAYLIYLLQGNLARYRSAKVYLQRGLLVASLLGLAVLATLGIGIMIDDLFTEFPVYAAETVDWGYAMEEGIAQLIKLQPAFDQTNLDTFGAISGIYLAYYTQFPPEARQAEVKQLQEHAWQRVGSIGVGQLEAHTLQPGCHLSLTSTERRHSLRAPNVRLTTFSLPDGQPGPLHLSAIASPQSDTRSIGAIFGNGILLDSFSPASVSSGQLSEAAGGQAVCLVLNWQSAGNLPADYTVFVHLVGPVNQTAKSMLRAQHDGMPVDGLRPTETWQPGEYIQDMHVIFVPADVPAGVYQINVGLYDAVTGVRLPVRQAGGSAGEYVTLLELDVR